MSSITVLVGTTFFVGIARGNGLESIREPDAEGVEAGEVASGWVGPGGIRTEVTCTKMGWPNRNGEVS